MKRKQSVGKVNIFLLLIAMFACGSSEYDFVVLEEGNKKIFVEAALERTKHKIIYNGSYFKLDYPNGDVPDSLGVCSDVVVRSYRKINIDLQQLLHEDIKKHFNDYPIKTHWPKQHKADSNIDHRRVPNLEVFLKKYGQSLFVSNKKENYVPGDVVTWNLMGSSPWHIGIVTNKISPNTKNPLIVHNIGQGPVLDDVLFKYPIRGHFRYFPK